MGFTKFIDDIKKKWPYEIDRIKMRLKLLKEQDWSQINKYFIISTGRTGTRFFAKFLNELSDVYATHEPTPDFLRLAIDYAQNNIEKEKAIKIMSYNRSALCKEVKRKNANIYIESNNRLFSLIDPLTEVFDDFKIVHIIRDGRDYVRSGMSRPWYTKEDKSPRMKATYFPDDPYCKRWSNMNRFEKICWRWQKKDGFILEKVRKIPNAITVKFEDIFKDDDYAGIYKIAQYLDLNQFEVEATIEKMMNRKVNSTKKYEISKWTEWDTSKKKSFDQIAGKHMNNYYNYNWK